MKKKHRIKYRKNNNEFSALFGIEAIQMNGGSNCLITKAMTTRDLQREAYFAYTNTPHNPAIKVSSSCCVTNCVKRDHLVGFYKPTIKDALYIKENLLISSKDWLANALNVPLSMFEEYLKNNP